MKPERSAPWPLVWRVLACLASFVASAALFAFAGFAAGDVADGLIIASVLSSGIFFLGGIGLLLPRTAWHLANWIWELGSLPLD